jgi:hypothetical protein
MTAAVFLCTLFEQILRCSFNGAGTHRFVFTKRSIKAQKLGVHLTVRPKLEPRS